MTDSVPMNNNDDTDFLEEIDPDINLLNEAIPTNLCKYYTVEEMNDIECFTDSFSIVNYNVRSFHSKNSENFLTMLNTLKFEYDCIILSETWNTERNNNLCEIPGYESFHTFRPKGHVYSCSGGISVFCNNLTVEQLTKNDSLSVCTPNIETCVVDATYRKLKNNYFSGLSSSSR